MKFLRTPVFLLFNLLFIIVLGAGSFADAQMAPPTVNSDWTKSMKDKANCEEIPKFQWQQDFAPEKNPYERKIGESLELSLSVKQDDPYKWYTVFKVNAPSDLAPFVNLVQEKVGWTQGDQSGNDYKGAAQLEIKTHKGSGVDDFAIPGLYTISITAEQDYASIIPGCFYTQTKTTYLSVKSDCDSKLANEKGCDDTANYEKCRKICEAAVYCRFQDGACKYFAEATQSDSTPSVPSTPASTPSAGELYPVPKGYVGALPPCAFSGTCTDVNNLVQLIVNFGEGMFAILGSFAFAFFVYGGFTMIMSMGNAEKIKKGQQIMIAAVVGLVIAFSAYLLIDFMLDAIGVSQEFRGIK